MSGPADLLTRVSLQNIWKSYVAVNISTAHLPSPLSNKLPAVATDQEMVREYKNSSRSEKSQELYSESRKMYFSKGSQEKLKF